MKGNEYIAEILKNDYEISDITRYEDIEYEIENFTDKLSKVAIKSKTGSFCPVYARFDGYHMSWYGDYVFFGFCCTWETNVFNLAYGSPYYLLEKLEGCERKVFNAVKCEQELLRVIKEGPWYQFDLNEEQKKRFEQFWNEDFSYVGDADEDCLHEYEEEAKKLKELQNSIGSEFEWLAAINKLEPDDENLFDCEHYELYNLGKEAPCRFFIILYMLSVVANSETANSAHPTEKGGGKE